MNPSAHSRFKLHAEVFWFAGTRYVLHSLASPMTVVSVQGPDGSCGCYSEVGKHCDICVKVVEALQVVEEIVVKRLKRLGVAAVFVVKRSGIGCCGDF